MPRKKEYYLVNHSDNKDIKQRQRIYETAAKIALKYGSFGHRFDKFTEENIREFWNYSEEPYPPGPDRFRGFVRLPLLKKFIQRTKLPSDSLWNGDFLWGLVQNGKVVNGKSKFPVFIFEDEHLKTLLESSPFGGDLRLVNDVFKWRHIPALCLPHSEDSLDFVAGFFAGGKIIEKDNLRYAAYRYPDKLKEWGVPIEDFQDSFHLISPIWPALFTKRMPSIAGSTFLNIVRAAKRDFYPPILWRIYTNKPFKRNAMPYLYGQRCIIKKFGGSGAMKRIEDLWIESSLTQLDVKIKAIIKEWENE